MFVSLSVKWYNDRLIGPVCCTNFLPYIERLPRSLKLLFPGYTPVKLLSSSTTVPIWSLTSPNVKVSILSLPGFLSKFDGISYKPLPFLSDFDFVLINTISFSANAVVNTTFASCVVLSIV